MRSLRSVFLIGMLAVLAHMACAVGEVGPASLLAAAPPACANNYLADVESDFAARVDLSTPGSSPQVLFDAYIPGTTAKILQTYQLVITLAPEFGFNGFGVAGSSVGMLEFDFGSDRSFEAPADFTIQHRAIDANTAYADSFANASYDPGIDATATHATGPGGTHVFTITLPSGGTNFGGVCSYFDTSTRFTLPAGFVRLPATPGVYDVSFVATSVDPDTGDANDHLGLPPLVYSKTAPVTVPEPTQWLASLTIVAALTALQRRLR